MKGMVMRMNFSEQLKAAMQQLGLNQSQAAGLTGCSRGAISQYLSGKNTPPKDKRQMIAASLGLLPNYFEGEQEAAIVYKKTHGAIRQLLVADAAKLMGMNHNTVRKGLQQGVFPWGYAIRTSKRRWTYFINAKRFAEIEGISLPPCF